MTWSRTTSTIGMKMTTSEHIVDRAIHCIRTTAGPLYYATGSERVAAAALDVLEEVGIIVGSLVPDHL